MSDSTVVIGMQVEGLGDITKALRSVREKTLRLHRDINTLPRTENYKRLEQQLRSLESQLKHLQEVGQKKILGSGVSSNTSAALREVNSLIKEGNKQLNARERAATSEAAKQEQRYRSQEQAAQKYLNVVNKMSRADDLAAGRIPTTEYSAVVNRKTGALEIAQTTRSPEAQLLGSLILKQKEYDRAREDASKENKRRSDYDLDHQKAIALNREKDRKAELKGEADLRTAQERRAKLETFHRNREAKQVQQAIGGHKQLVANLNKEADATARLSGQARKTKYVSIQNPDGSFSVGTVKKSNAELVKMSDLLNKSKNSSGALSSALHTITRILAVSIGYRAFYGMLRGFNKSIDDAGKLYKAIAEIRTISQSDGSTSADWRGSMIGLSSQMGVASADVNEATYQALSNQIVNTRAEAEPFVKTAILLGKVTQASAEQGVNALSSAINAYGLNVQDAERLSALFFKGVELGRYRLSEISDSLGTVSVMGSELGVTFEETLALLDLLTRKGIKANVAMTQIRGMFNQMLKPPPGMEKALNAKGYASAFGAIADKGFIETLGMLSDFVKDDVPAIAKMFTNQRGLTGGLSVVPTESLKAYKEELRLLTEDALPDYKKATDIVLADASYQWDKIKVAIANAFTVGVGGPFMEFLSKNNEAIDGLIAKMSKLASQTGDFVDGLSEINKYLDNLNTVATGNKTLAGTVSKLATTPEQRYLRSRAKNAFGWVTALGESKNKEKKAAADELDFMKKYNRTVGAVVADRQAANKKFAYINMNNAFNPKELKQSVVLNNAFVNSTIDSTHAVEGLKMASSEAFKALSTVFPSLVSWKEIGTGVIHEFTNTQEIDSKKLLGLKDKINQGITSTVDVALKYAEQKSEQYKDYIEALKTEIQSVNSMITSTEKHIDSVRKNLLSAERSKSDFELSSSMIKNDYLASWSGKDVSSMYANMDLMKDAISKELKEVDTKNAEISDALSQKTAQLIEAEQNNQFKTAQSIRDDIVSLREEGMSAIGEYSGVISQEENLLNDLYTNRSKYADRLRELSGEQDESLSKFMNMDETEIRRELKKIDALIEESKSSISDLYDTQTTDYDSMSLDEQWLLKSEKQRQAKDDRKLKEAEANLSSLDRLIKLDPEVVKESTGALKWINELVVPLEKIRIGVNDPKSFIATMQACATSLYGLKENLPKEGDVKGFNVVSTGVTSIVNSLKSVKETQEKFANFTQEVFGDAQKIGDVANPLQASVGQLATNTGQLATNSGTLSTNTLNATGNLTSLSNTLPAATQNMYNYASSLQAAAAAMAQLAAAGGAPGSAGTVAEGHATGGYIFRRRGTDTVPAMLTPGEFVMNAAATAMYLPLLRSLNSRTKPLSRIAPTINKTQYLSQGGQVTLNLGGINYSSSGGKPTQADIAYIGKELEKKVRHGLLSLSK